MVSQRHPTLLQLKKIHKLLIRVWSQIGSLWPEVVRLEVVRAEVVRAFIWTLYPKNNWQDIFDCWIVISNSHHYGSIGWYYTHCCHLVIPCIWMYLSGEFRSTYSFRIQNHYIFIWLRIFWLWKLKIPNFGSSKNYTKFRHCRAFFFIINYPWWAAY